MGMSSVCGICKAYLSTLRSARTGKTNKKALAMQIALPVVIGLVVGLFAHMTIEVGNAVTGISIVAALLCAMATMLFQIRINLREKFEEDSQAFLTGGDLILVDELFAEVIWAILFGMILALAMIIADWFGLFKSVNDVVSRIATGTLIACIVHFALVIGMILKRLNRVYLLVAVHKR